MIKEHPFTTLCDLLRDPSREVINIFSANVRRPQSLSGRPLYEMVLSTSYTDNRFDAEQKIKQLQSIISRCGDNIEVFKAVNQVLTTEGMGKLISLVINNLPKDEFLNNNIQNLFTGMPIFKIKVEEHGIPFCRLDKTVGKYDIKFVHSGSNIPDELPITFKTTAAKTLFLLFLLIGGKIIYNINVIKPVFSKIIEKSFDFSDNLLNDIQKDFKKLIRTNKPYANSNIKEALNGRDDDNWYIIDYDHSKQYYSLSLPEVKIDISGCPELKVFKGELESILK